MPAYNFQGQFVPMILDGSKVHTIRRRRKHPTKVGDMLCLYTGMRTKQCKLIVMTECVKVEPIAIIPNEKSLLIPNIYNGWDWLSVSEINRIAHEDGFENVNDFFDFFKRYREEVLYDFEIIWWDPRTLTLPSPKRRGEGVCLLGFDMRKD